MHELLRWTLILGLAVWTLTCAVLLCFGESILWAILTDAIKAGSWYRVSLLQPYISDDIVGNATPSPYYYLHHLPNTLTPETENIFHFVATTFKDPNRDASIAHHPLTALYKSRKSKLARHLLSRTYAVPLIMEVFAQPLHCADIELLDARLQLVITPKETRSCAIDHPRSKPYEKSSLAHAYHAYHNSSQDFTSVPLLSDIPSDWFTRPFENPPLDVLPPRTELVMNPAHFSDMREALFYYFVGYPASTGEMTALMLVVCVVMILNGVVVYLSNA